MIVILIGIGCVIADTITAIKNAKTKRRLPEVAKNAPETKKIISYLKSASTAKVDRVECQLSVPKASEYPGNELILLNITLYDSELAHIYAEAKGRVRAEIERPIGTSTMKDKMQRLEDTVRKETQYIYEVISSYFPPNPNPDDYFLKKFAVMNDFKTIILTNSITVPFTFLSGTLGIEMGKGPIRSPYVLDAVAEAAKDIPNISITIDKTIPAKNK